MAEPASPQVTYDFSRWSEAGVESATVATIDPEPVEDAVPVTFRVYTPEEIKSKQFRKAPSAVPPRNLGLKGVREAIDVAQSLGAKALVTRMIVGGLVGAVLLASFIGLARLVDDTPDHGDQASLAAPAMLAPLPATALPTTAPAPTVAARPVVTALAAAPAPAPRVYSTDDDVIELPATPPPPISAPPLVSRGGRSARTTAGVKRPDAGRNPIVRVSPY